ncbi:exodeoxyribonuclease VII large subunit [Paenactinomyces guangxiensis]|uniref:Exodeoxyribonuclease 7 large subunit n=1 Tax=Paenactinomyces guangxiensis TaxID=1490290 RepID=A0A7W1WS84_9BACL|nr:exodeoxyribonuclease VII large subunit [Paenactinomyces guangxiensis]MBA4494999.1 exodeoxyribonuclease VII large subunit [Paenactinomyces guangxiensis]MBH8592082.1 exodeoxyribonuclease VII large subunit [Paenactinomyces guangxiensis]
MIRNSEREIWSVTDLVTYLYQTLDADSKLKSLWIEGEISNFSQHPKSRHMYFTLKDEYAKIKAAMFAGNNRRLRFTPKDGDQVLVRGYLSVYDREGQVQFYAQDMRLSGVGDLYVAFQRLKEQLALEGLFSQPKKTIPLFPKTVGVITSASGAAVRDIITTMKRRFPLTNILLYPVSVQGDKAAGEIAEAIEQMNILREVDVLIVGRGGGSLEELWAFNEEVVARSIFQSELPVISAVGHETDTTISDFVADQRAATPTAAAEMVVPHINDLKDRICSLEKRLIHAQSSQMAKFRDRLARSIERPVFQNPNARLHQYAQRVDHLQSRLEHAMKKWTVERSRKLDKIIYRMDRHHPAEQIAKLQERVFRCKQDSVYAIKNKLREKRSKHMQLVGQLDALSPLKVMQRGYSLVYRYHQNELIKSYRQVQPGDLIRVRMADGQLKCQVWRSEEKNHE